MTLTYPDAVHARGAAATRWVEVGRSTDPDPHRAGTEAAAGALCGRDAKLVVVFASGAYDLPRLVGAVSAAAADAELVGCSTAGEIAGDGPGDAGVVVIAFGGSGFEVASARVSGVAVNPREAGAEVARCVLATESCEHRVLMLLTDGLAGDQQEIVRGAYQAVGNSVPLVGGCAGDDLAMTQTFQFHGDEVLENAVVAVAIGSDRPIGIGVKHGWRRVGKPMLASRTEGNVVHELDERPALDVYLELLDPPSAAHAETADFTRFSQTHPLGLSRRAGEEHVRFVGGADFERRVLRCIAEVPQGSLVWLMEGDAKSMLQATRAACGEALDALDGAQPLGMIAFDCIARRGVLGDAGIEREISEIARLAGGAPVAGFYTYGEIARTRGATGFHNQTLVVLAVG